jgi:hypothetical protein
VTGFSPGSFDMPRRLDMHHQRLKASVQHTLDAKCLPSTCMRPSQILARHCARASVLWSMWSPGCRTARNLGLPGTPVLRCHLNASFQLLLLSCVCHKSRTRRRAAPFVEFGPLATSVPFCMAPAYNVVSSSLSLPTALLSSDHSSLSQFQSSEARGHPALVPTALLHFASVFATSLASCSQPNCSALSSFASPLLVTGLLCSHLRASSHVTYIMANWLAQKTVLTRTAFDSKCYKWADPAAPGYDPVKAAHSWEILNDRFDKHNDRRTLQEGKPYEFALHHFGVTEQWTRILLAGHPASSSDEGRLYPAIIYSGPMDSALGFLLDKPITADGKFHQSFSKTRFYTEDKYKELLNAYITIHRRMLPAWHIYVQRMHEDIEYGRKDDPCYLLQYGKVRYRPLAATS